MERIKDKRGRRLFSAALFLIWLTFMALAGFFIPSFLSELPLFQVKEIIVEGNRSIDLDTVRSAVYSADGSVLRLKEDQILRVLNERTGGRVKKVFLAREVTLKGVSVKIRIEERVPVAKLKTRNTFLFIDRDGVTFPAYANHPKGLVEITTYDLEVLEANFPRLYSQIEKAGIRVSKIRVLKDKTVLISGRRTLILPPIELLPDNLAERLSMIYNFEEGKIDLRFDRFILVRN